MSLVASLEERFIYKELNYFFRVEDEVLDVLEGNYFVDETV